MKKLTDKGVDEVIDIEYPKETSKEQEEPKMIPRKEAQKKAVKVLNGGNINKTYGLKTMKKSTIIALWSLLGLLILLLLIGGIYALNIFDKKDFSPEVTNQNTINVEPSNVSVPVNNNYENNYVHNITIEMDLSEEFLDTLTDEIIEIINNKTNSS